MEEQKDFLKSAIVLALMLLFGTGLFFWKAGFFEPKKPNCSAENIIKCSKEECSSNNFFWWDAACHLTDEVKSKPSDYPDFDSLSTMHKLTIAENFESWTPNSNKPEDKQVITLIVEDGDIAKGYVYYKASLNNKPLTQWESIFLQLNGRGGHLFRPQSLPLPSPEKTELLYALNYIPFLTTIPYSENKNPTSTNWFNYFKKGRQIQVQSFISSLRTSMIEEFSIYYQCVNEPCELKLK